MLTPAGDDIIVLGRRGPVLEVVQTAPQGRDRHPWIAGGAQDTQGFHPGSTCDTRDDGAR